MSTNLTPSPVEPAPVMVNDQTVASSSVPDPNASASAPVHGQPPASSSVPDQTPSASAPVDDPKSVVENVEDEADPEDTSPLPDSFLITVQNFTEDEKKILLETIQNVKKAKTKEERSKLTKKAETDILSLEKNKIRPRPEREEIMKKTREWLRAHARVTKAEKTYTKIWSGPYVMYQQDPDPVKEKQESLFRKAQSKPQKKAITKFGCFARALDFVWKRLSEEERAEHKATANKWNMMGPGDNVKAR